MIYATGGVAFGDVEVGIRSDPPSDSAIRTGYIVGGGIEYLLGSTFRLRGEVLYYNFPNYSYDDPAFTVVWRTGVPADNDTDFVVGRVGLSVSLHDVLGPH